MRIWKRNRMLKRIVLGFALVALVVPAGSAKAVPDAGRTYEPAQVEIGVQVADPKFGQSVDEGTVQLADPKYGQFAEHGVQLADPKYRQPGVNAYVPFATDFPKYVPTNGVSTPQSTPQVVSSGDGFDWGDAGIGAGILAGLVLLGAAGLLATRHLGKAQTA
jgi:hypothetical protein